MPADQEDYDGTLLPTDFKQAGEIRDTELARLLVHPLPAGVVLHALFDSCHSGGQGLSVGGAGDRLLSLVVATWPRSLSAAAWCQTTICVYLHLHIYSLPATVQRWLVMHEADTGRQAVQTQLEAHFGHI